MKDIRLERLAKLLIHYSLKLQAGQKLLIRGSDITAPLIKEAYGEAIAVGAHPEVEITLAGLDELLLKEGNENQIVYLSPRENILVEEYDALLVIWGSHNTKPLANVPSEKIAMKRGARKAWMSAFSKRVSEGTMRWVGTQFPTHSDAQEAGMTLDEYEAFVFGAGQMESDKYLEHWQGVSAKQQKLADFLETKETLRFKGPDTDLTFGIAGRKWRNCDGSRNFPDGEVFTTPHREQVNGHIRYTFPAIYSGREVEDVRIVFKDGKAVEATAEKGEEFLNAMLDTDEGARFVGEVAIGMNYGIVDFTKNILFDEKIGGTVHVALGSGFPETGGNNESGIHWDMICDLRNGGAIYADGEKIFENGKMIIQL